MLYALDLDNINDRDRVRIVLHCRIIQFNVQRDIPKWVFGVIMMLIFFLDVSSSFQ